MTKQTEFRLGGILINHLTHDSREVREGSCFFAIKGQKSDGTEFISDAVRNKAALIVCEAGTAGRIGGVPFLFVPDVRETMALAAKEFYGSAADKMDIIGVTGTNGKTTCTYVLRDLLGGAVKKNGSDLRESLGTKETGVRGITDSGAGGNTGGGLDCGLAGRLGLTFGAKGSAGSRIGVIGTLGSFVGGVCLDKGLTTPDPIRLHGIFAKMYSMGVKAVIMEVSAHAIFYRKIAGIDFRAVCFTNITQDHLDFFGNMAEYADTKVGFVSGESVRHAAVNSDDAYGREIISRREEAGASVSPCSFADISELVMKPDGAEFCIGRDSFAMKLAGRFNIDNALLCIRAAAALGIPMRKIVKRLALVNPVPGRFNVYSYDNYDLNEAGRYARRRFSVIVDYAHTPDGLEKILIAARDLAHGNRVIAVFGCGGNRDTGKRKIMGAIAKEHADFTVVTSDNPRDERPMDIMLQIREGFGIDFPSVPLSQGEKKETEFDSTDGVTADFNLAEKFAAFTLIEDRKEATVFALDMATDGDVVVIAGKGAEDTQEIAGVFHPYSDAETVREYIRGK